MRIGIIDVRSYPGKSADQCSGPEGHSVRVRVIGWNERLKVLMIDANG